MATVEATDIAAVMDIAAATVEDTVAATVEAYTPATAEDIVEVQLLVGDSAAVAGSIAVEAFTAVEAEASTGAAVIAKP